MTVFKTFLKVLNRYKGMVILYTVMLIVFGGLNMKSNNQTTDFIATKPSVLIINNDENVGLTKGLIDYISENSDVKNIENNDDSINDALFYREVNYIIYIPENFRKDILSGKNPEILVKSTGDYQANLAEMMVERYVKLANVYIKGLYENESVEKESEIIEKIKNVLNQNTEIQITTKLDTTNLAKLSRYYSFANYTLLAGVIFVICTILSSFRNEMVNKRTIISSTNYKKHNLQLMLANSLFAICLWGLYIIVSFILFGNAMCSLHGLLYGINSFVFVLCTVSIAFLISSLVKSKGGINGIVNVVALGSSFLCGSFVPTQWLPDYVIKIAHILPSYWFIHNNELIQNIEVVNFDSLKIVFINMGIVVLFTIGYVVCSNFVVRRKRVLGNNVFSY